MHFLYIFCIFEYVKRHIAYTWFLLFSKEFLRKIRLKFCNTFANHKWQSEFIFKTFDHYIFIWQSPTAVNGRRMLNFCNIIVTTLWHRSSSSLNLTHKYEKANLFASTLNIFLFFSKKRIMRLDFFLFDHGVTCKPLSDNYTIWLPFISFTRSLGKNAQTPCSKIHPKILDPLVNKLLHSSSEYCVWKNAY